MPDITRAQTNELMSDFVCHYGTAYLSGQVAMGKAGEPFEVQVRDIFERIDALLAAAGSDKTHLLTASVWLTDMARFADFNAIWLEWLEGCPKPVRAAVGAPLALPGLEVEVQVSAAVL